MGVRHDRTWTHIYPGTMVNPLGYGPTIMHWCSSYPQVEDPYCTGYDYISQHPSWAWSKIAKGTLILIIAPTRGRLVSGLDMRIGHGDQWVTWPLDRRVLVISVGHVTLAWRFNTVRRCNSSGRSGCRGLSGTLVDNPLDTHTGAVSHIISAWNYFQLLTPCLPLFKHWLPICPWISMFQPNDHHSNSLHCIVID